VEELPEVESSSTSQRKGTDFEPRDGGELPHSAGKVGRGKQNGFAQREPIVSLGSSQRGSPFCGSGDYASLGLDNDVAGEAGDAIKGEDGVTACHREDKNDSGEVTPVLYLDISSGQPSSGLEGAQASLSVTTAQALGLSKQDLHAMHERVSTSDDGARVEDELEV
jgi:hypothetical protein